MQKNTHKKQAQLGESVSKRGWANQDRARVGRTSIKPERVGRTSTKPNPGPCSHERSTKGRWANKYLSASTYKCLFGTVPARHVLQCLLGTSYSACSAHLPTSACSALLSACSALLSACSALPTPQPQRQTLVVLRQDVPPYTHGSLTGNEKNSGVWGVHARHNQAKPCNTMQNQAKSCHAKIKQCEKNRAKRAITPVRTYMYRLE